MAEFIITIKDEPGSFSVGLSGPDDQLTTAFFLARALMRLVPEAAVSAARAAAANGNCPCPKCSAKRETAGQAQSNEPKPTLH